MHSLKLAGLTSAIALVACVTTFEDASAQAVYGGGGTLASKVYRQLFDCWGIPNDISDTTTYPAPDLSHCSSPTGRVVAPSAQIVYAPVGSGAGKRAFVNHDGSTSTTTGLGTPAASNAVPYTSHLLSAYGYPGFHFAGSDDVLTQSDLDAYNGAAGSAHPGVDFRTKYGQMLQIPAFVTPVTIAFNGKDGNGVALNINNANLAPAGSTSKLNLSRQAYCGIFSGHITKWNNPILTALNGGVALGTGNITVVHRQDGSGTTFLTTNALAAQCGFAVLNGPNSETDPTIVSYAFPWTNRTLPAGTCSATPVGANLINWPDLGTDQCGAAISNPGGGHFAQASGSGGVTTTAASTNGAVTYVSPDFVKPVVATGLATANLQDYNDIVNATGSFNAPTPANATTAMSTANFNLGAGLTSPLVWSTNGVNPEPIAPGAYPLAGFTWFDLYQCYEPTQGAELGLTAFLQWHYTSTDATNILNANGFAPVPFPWFNDAAVLAIVSSSSFAYPTVGSCGTVVPPGA
jgi:ABC-type phosphate transport system substrate-binding protein